MPEGYRNSDFSRVLTFTLGLSLWAAGAEEAGVPIPHGTVDLIAENQWITSGHTLNVGLRFQMEKGWHIYWINPGDSGEPPKVKWQLPAGLTTGPMEWPTPRRLGTASIVDYGYEDTVMLIVPIHAGKNLAARINSTHSQFASIGLSRNVHPGQRTTLTHSPRQIAVTCASPLSD